MTDQNISDVVKTLIQAQVVQALKEGPQAIDALVQAALSKPVDSLNGKTDGYSGNRVPFLEYLVGETIRDATREAVRKVVVERASEIEAAVRKAVSADDFVSAYTKAVLGITDQDWRMTVKFEAEKEKRY